MVFLVVLCVWKGFDDDVMCSVCFLYVECVVFVCVLVEDCVMIEFVVYCGLFLSWFVWVFCVIYFFDVFVIYGYMFWVLMMIK